MNRAIFEVCDNAPIARDVYRMRISGDTSALTTPGQFVNVELEGLYLRRPLSVCDWDGEGMVLIYKVVGAGTRKLAGLRPGATLDLLVGLGNGFDPSKSGERPLLVGGGVGVPPLYALGKHLVALGKKPKAALGFNAAEDAFYLNEFRALGIEVFVATVDGSLGAKGSVTEAMKMAGEHDFFYACGPEPMLRAVSAATKADGQLSFEERMGCGFGACMGCSCQTKYGAFRICKDGPVLDKKAVIF